jgi:translation elongation factor P/translation initiation factor 5A
MLDPNVVSLFQQMQQNLEQPSMEDRYQFIISPSDCEYKFEDDEQYQSVNINITSPKSAADLAVKNS